MLNEYEQDFEKLKLVKEIGLEVDALAQIVLENEFHTTRSYQ